ncbi:response regulator transcription factor [Aeromonas sobria]|nr:LuxR C-terminal-related transcriptional regulator [Aeromonas sobria]MBS4689797.1 response regulator transcription factor [Aeromonas sobria]
MRAVLIGEAPILEMTLKLIFKEFKDPDVVLDVVGRADNGCDGIKLIHALRPGLIIVDADKISTNTFEMFKKIKGISENAKVVLFSTLNPEHLKNQLFVVALDRRNSIEKCIKQFKLALSTSFSHPKNRLIQSKYHNAINNPYSLALLSARETLVLKHLALGEKNHEIAEKYNLSPKTISTYKYRITKKLGAQTIFDLRDFAIINNLI